MIRVQQAHTYQPTDIYKPRLKIALVCLGDMLYSSRLQEIGLKPAPPAQDVTIVHITMILLVIHETKTAGCEIYYISATNC